MDTYRRSGKRKKQISLDMGVMQFFLPYLIASGIVLLVLYFVTALVYMFTSIPAGALPAISRIETAAVLMFFAAAVGHEAREGIAHGGFFGLVFTGVLLFFGMIMRGISLFSLLFLILLVTGVLLGALGGIIGSEKHKRARRRRLRR